MNRPHFFINKDAGNFLLHTDLPSIDTINNIDFILDLIDLPYYLHFSSAKKAGLSNSFIEPHCIKQVQKGLKPVPLLVTKPAASSRSMHRIH